MSVTPKNILVTGATSFVMRNCLPTLQREFPDSYIYTPSSKHYDLLDKRETEALMYQTEDCEPWDVVIHCAARVAGIMGNIGNGGLFMYENLLMGLNLLEACRVGRVKRLINVSSICSFPTIPKVIPFVESEADGELCEVTNRGYGLSKRTIMHACEEYHKQYGMDTITILPTNMVGLYDNLGPGAHVIPNLIERLYKAIRDDSKVFECFGSGRCTRDFLDARDFAQALIKVIRAEPNSLPRRINLGSGKETSIKELVYKIAGIMGYKGDIVFNENYPDGQPRRVLDISRARQCLDWSPKYSLDESLRDVVDWYVSNADGLRS